MKTRTSGNIIWNSYKSINKILRLFPSFKIKDNNITNAIVSFVISLNKDLTSYFTNKGEYSWLSLSVLENSFAVFQVDLRSLFSYYESINMLIYKIFLINRHSLWHERYISIPVIFFFFFLTLPGPCFFPHFWKSLLWQ